MRRWIIVEVSNSLSTSMNDSLVRRLAGAQSYQRGLDYFEHGHVESLEETTDGLRALVRGSQDYTVVLTTDEGMIDYSCDCPVGGEGAFCKHCVAVALAWLNRATGQTKPAGRRKPKEVTLADAAKMLQSESSTTLAQMLLNWAKHDDRLRERLILYAARRSGPESGVTAVSRAFQNAVRVRGFVHYREARNWAREADDAIDGIDQLLADGQAAAVIGVCESALRGLLSAIESVDDSDGHFAVLRDRLEDIHYRACYEVRPDPVELAKRLFEWELHGGLDVFYDAAIRYADILGADGIKVYRKLAEAEWAKVPARTAKNDRFGWDEHFHITHIMESLAQVSGDIEGLVAVISRDLSCGYSYLRIAEIYRQAGQPDKALEWAEKGLRAFPTNTDQRLREFAAEEYHSRRRHDEAMQLIWAQFTERPFLDSYQILEKHARTAGTWAAWRDRALGDIRSQIEKAKKKARGREIPRWMPREDDHSVLVEIFLYERNFEQAWSEAKAGGCSGGLLLKLAGLRESEHPEDAAPIYLNQAEARIAATTNGRYEEAAELLIKAAAAMKRLGRGAEFTEYLDALRARYKIKRNFVKLIERNRKSLYLG